jgi:hypothetical protein
MSLLGVFFFIHWVRSSVFLFLIVVNEASWSCDESLLSMYALKLIGCEVEGPLVVDFALVELKA